MNNGPESGFPADRCPNWMRYWLIAAGVYNLLWGAAAVVAPVRFVRGLGVTPASDELWPQFFACIGMIVGVYGLGYLIASRDPARHWPIVLVGLAGKILGPIGFVDAAVRGTLPWSMGWTILTNDLVWWAPFGMILWHAARAAQPAPPRGEIALPDALEASRDDTGRTLRSMSDERPMLLVLLRHAGCTFCRETLMDLSRQQEAIRAGGVGIAVAHQSAGGDVLRPLADRYGLGDVAWIADPDRRLYRALHVGRGSFLQLFGPRVWIRGLSALLRGIGVGKLSGDGFQMPGAFVIHRGRVVREFRHSTAADRPDYQELACAMPSR